MKDSFWADLHELVRLGRPLASGAEEPETGPVEPEPEAPTPEPETPATWAFTEDQYNEMNRNIGYLGEALQQIYGGLQQPPQQQQFAAPEELDLYDPTAMAQYLNNQFDRMEKHIDSRLHPILERERNLQSV